MLGGNKIPSDFKNDLVELRTSVSGCNGKITVISRTIWLEFQYSCVWLCLTAQGKSLWKRVPQAEIPRVNLQEVVRTLMK